MTPSLGRAGERRIVLHLGMLKTGSTSIQTVWNGYKDDRIEFAQLGLPNHSLMLQRAFLGEKDAGRIFRNAGPADWSKLREGVRRRLGNLLAGTPRSVILSGESLSRFDLDSARHCVEFLRRYADGVDGLLYVRAPESYARSVFQEMLKRGEASFSPRQLVPSYRSQSQTWAEALGAEPTHVLFDRATLYEGDAVMDFGVRTGLDLDWARARAHLQDRNASLSAEATAALYLLRHRCGAPATHKEERTRQRRLIEVLGGYGIRRYDFGRDLMEAALADRAEEIAWIEGRLGRPFPKETVKDPVFFSSEREILDYGEAQAGPLGEYLRERGIVGGRASSSTVDLLESVLSLAKGSSNIHRGSELRKRHLSLKTILGGLGRQFARVRR